MRSRLRNIGVAARLTGAFVIVGVLVGLLAWVGISGSQRVQQTHEWASQQHAWAYAAHRLKSALLEEVWAQKNYVLRGEEHYLRLSQEHAKTVNEFRAQLAALVTTDSDRGALQLMEKQIRGLREAFARATVLRQEGDVEGADAVMRGKAAAVLATLDSSIGRAEASATKAARTAAEVSRRTRIWTMLLAVAVGVFAVAVGIALSASITRPVGILRRAVETVAKGGAPPRAPALFFHDELSRAIDAFHCLVQKAALLQKMETRSSQLEALSARMAWAQEDERRRVARELHDGLGQYLTALKFELSAAAGLPEGRQGDVEARLARANRLVDQTLQEIRRLALGLRPAVLDSLGLLAALRWYVRDHPDWSAGRVTIQAHNMDGRLPSEVETALFRIAQEALGNVAKHAGAQHVAIELHRDDSAVTLLIRDDGRGMDVQALYQAAGAAHGLGLLGMERRARELGGDLEIRSAPGKGTEIRVRVPVNKEDEAWRE